MSQAKKAKKAEKARLQTIERELQNLDKAYASTPSPDLYKKRLLFHSEYDLLTTRTAERQLKQTKQTFFEQGDKAGNICLSTRDLCLSKST